MLGAVADGANEAASAEEAFRIALREVCRVAGWAAGHVYVATSGPVPRLEDIGTWEMADPRYEAVRREVGGTALRAGEAAAGRALQEGTPQRIDDVMNDPTFPKRDVVAQTGLRGVYAVPVPVGREVVAVLQFLSPGPPADDPALLDAVESAGVILGRVVERARAEDTLQRVRTELSERLAALESRVEAPTGGDEIHDRMTGLFTEAYLVETLRLETARADRSRRPVTVIALAVDGLDAVESAGNGEAVASIVRTTAEILRTNVREGDVASRFGNEFMVVLPGVSAGMGRARAQQLRRGVDALRLTTPDGTALTTSAGFACFPDHGATHDALLAAAKEALAKAVEEGGGRLGMAKVSLERWTGARKVTR